MARPVGSGQPAAQARLHGLHLHVQFAQPPHFLCVVGFQLFQLVGQGLHVGAIVRRRRHGRAVPASAASANG